MEASRSVPQQTAQIFSAFAGQKRSAFLFSQIGQVDKCIPQGKSGGKNIARLTKCKIEAERLKRVAKGPAAFEIQRKSQKQIPRAQTGLGMTILSIGAG